ncbi:ABC transporter substrate-binding protein SapA [Photobacterium damselae]|uniref:ABC transporter substrate-binding protein SapA n=1 Tax=Photobacterium damselae TaxID=38293 RepID=UPI001EECF862|nr:ABC transporter substrate-binding protein SapA [Photobacterium damselae]UKA30230.1 peptide ABC transporter substrate-binding protein SapA [Photobacterium damselae subsp. damselae]
MSAYTRLLLACAGLLSLFGCSEPTKENTIRDTGFIYCGQDTPTTLNPQLADGGLTVDSLGAQIFDRLLTLDPVSHHTQSELAKSWKVSDDGLVYTFTLRKNIPFQTTPWFTPSRPLNAEDVVFSFERIIDPNNPFHNVSGGRYPWFESNGFNKLIKSITVVNPNTVRFTLNRPDNAFLSNLATSYAVVYSKEYAEQLLKSGQLNKLDLKPIGTGPFYLSQYQPNDFIRLKRNDAYWRGKPAMEQVVFDISSRGTGTLAKLLSQECDVLSSPVASQLPVISNDKNFNLTAQTGMNVAFLAFNTEKKPLNNLKVREAISMAINREALLNSVYYGTATNAKSLLPPMSWAYNHDSVVPNYDPKEAKALLKQAGYNHNLTLTMWVPLEPRPYNPSPRKTAELIQANLKSVGVNLVLDYQEQVDRTSLSNINKFDLILSGWIADNGDPDNFLRPLLSCDAKEAQLNIANWCNLQFDNLLELALRTNQQSQRLNYYYLAQDILDKDLPILPLAHGVYFQANNKSLSGVQMSPFGTRSFADVHRSE